MRTRWHHKYSLVVRTFVSENRDGTNQAPVGIKEHFSRLEYLWVGGTYRPGIPTYAKGLIHGPLSPQGKGHASQGKPR
jgi:hypothetical protein